MTRWICEIQRHISKPLLAVCLVDFANTEQGQHQGFRTRNLGSRDISLQARETTSLSQILCICACPVAALIANTFSCTVPFNVFMSGFGSPGGGAVSIKPTPPERGSFPLDHDAECKHIISSYLRCLRRQNPPGKNNEECRILAKEYLGCRMEKGLMAKDEWQNLGLNFDKIAVDEEVAKVGSESADKKTG